MATRLYLRSTSQNSNVSPSSERSAALPTGTNNSVTITGANRLSTTKGSTQVNNPAFSSLAQTSLQSGNIDIWVSDPLNSQTISSNTWTLFLKTKEEDAAANANSAASVYIWRPSQSIVVGYIYDSINVLNFPYQTGGSANEWSSSYPTAAAATFSGSQVIANEGDVLVYEVWYRASQSKASSYYLDIYYNGTDDTTTGDANTSTASYIETPQNLNFMTSKSSIIFVM